MKKLAMLLLVSLICGLAFAAGVEHTPTSYMSAFEIQAQDQSRMELTFSLPEFEINEEITNGQVYHRIALPNAGTLMQSGMPELPVITTTIAIPHQGGVEIEMLHSEHSILSQYNAYPLQQGQELESPRAFVKNDDYYSDGAGYPHAAIEYSDPMILRDFRIVTLQVNPFNYNADTQELTVYNNMHFRMNFTDEPGQNELSLPVHNISRSFDKIYSALIQNYDDYRDVFIADTPPRYLIIHGHTTDNTFLGALDQYVLWKRQKGADVDVATTASNQAGSSNSSIQTYIRNRYNNPNTRPDFVILIGDTTGSFSIPAFMQRHGGTDYPYSHMNTGDILGDLFVGRISVENTTQFLVLLNKIFLYERDINVDMADWLNRMVLAGDNQPSGISTMYISKYIKEMALETNEDYTFTETYGPSFPNMVSTINGAINQGVGFYSFRGYIDFRPPDESALFNGPMLPHTVVITCSTNNYWNGLGRAEAFIRYGTTAVPKGAVTAIGMSTSSTSTTFNNVIHGAIFEGIFARGMRTMGEALLHAKLYMNDMFSVSAPANVADFTHWANLMGDPSMEVFTGIPNRFETTRLDSIPLGLALLDVAVIDSLGLPVEDASVVLSSGFDILSRGYTDSEGNVILILPQDMTAGQGVLTVHKHNFKPLQESIDIVAMDTLVPGEIVIDDDNQGASEGNDDGIVTAGETVEIFFGLKNMGSETVSGVTGTVVSDNPWITITQSDISYPPIPGGGVGNNLSPIVIEVDPATPHQTLLRLRLLCTDSEGNEYDVSEFTPVEAARAIFIELDVFDDDGNGNGVLDPGETVDLTVTVRNNGAATVQNIYARLYTENDLLSVVSNTAFIGDLPLATDVSSSITEPFSVWQRPQTLPGMVMPLYIRLYNDDGFEQIVHFSLTVGEVGQNDPLGPDSYGYVIYDWTDTAYPEVATYEWIEIAPQEGGLGTALPISDSYASNDEGDQVGAQSLATVNLPFPFQFYGRLYDQITVCSNGFIAMGITENAEFRNFRLPGAMGPSPMIAPFWDDLATHSGSGIYYLFDRSNQSFIVEWYNLYNGYNGSSLERFQVILYDQATYNTSLGDGPIKFQYHTFNNVNSQSGRRHGSYCSIGIEDHTGTRGLEYTFNNIYPTAAAPLSDGKALYITNVPIYHEEANILITQTYLDDPNNVVEPGDTVNLGIRLENSGNLLATDIEATLSTQNQYITIENASSEYFPLDSEESGVNRSPFTFTVSQDCPSGEVIHFSLHVESGEVFWDRQFSLRVDSSQLQYHSFMISDYEGNFNGVIDPDEAVKLIINLRNASDVEARDVSAELSSDLPSLEIANPTIEGINIAGNQIMQLVYDLDFAGMGGGGSYLPLNFTAIPASGEPAAVTLHIPFNLPNVEHEFEINNGGFISETGWTWGVPTQIDAYSGEKVWGTNLSGGYPINISYHLYTPRYYLGDASELNFQQYYDVEDGYDGINVSISTDAGNNWTVISPVGGYNGSSLAGLNSEDGWTGSSNAWVLASFDLAAYAGQEVMFRFRLGSNGSVSGEGWLIDNFQLTDVNLKTGFVEGMIYPTSGMDASLGRVSSSRRFVTIPASDGSFRLYLANGTHSVTASMPGHQGSTLNNVHINIDDPVVNTEFTLIELPAVDSPAFDVDNNSGLFTMIWSDPLEPVFPVSGYRVYRKFDSGPYEMALETAETVYSEVFELEGVYRYYIVPMYLGEEGSATDVITVPFPYTGVEDELSPQLQTKLGRNYPNPFNPTTTISFNMAEAAPASIRIYNSKGQFVRQLANDHFAAGPHSLVWDGRDMQGRSVSSGLYLYRLSTKNYSKSRKMILMK